MAETTVNLGFLPKNRGEYQSNTRYYKDNIVQYNGSSYICDPVGYSDSNPTDTYTTIAPTDSSGNLNPGWRVFASGNNTFTTGESVTEVGIDDEPISESDNLIKSGGVQNELALGAVYDVSAKNPTAGPNNDGKFTSLSALLSDANLNTLIPTAVRKGGMSIKFIQTSDNNSSQYVQYRYMGTAINGSPNPFTNPANWQGVDDVPTAGSDNLVTSGGVKREIHNDVPYIIISEDAQVQTYQPINIKQGHTYRLQKTENFTANIANIFFRVERSNTGQSVVQLDSTINHIDFTADKDYNWVMFYNPTVTVGGTEEIYLYDLNELLLQTINDKSKFSTNETLNSVGIDSETSNNPANLIKSKAANDIKVDANLDSQYLGQCTRYSYQGYISSNLWALAVQDSGHRLVKVNGGDTVTFKSNADNGSRYAFLKSYVTPVQLASPDYATGSSNTSVNANTDVEVIAPIDAKYLYLFEHYYTSNFLPADLKVNGKSVYFTLEEKTAVQINSSLAPLQSNISSLNTNVTNTNNDLSTINDIINKSLGSATSDIFTGAISSGQWTMAQDRHHRLLKVNGGDTIEFKANSFAGSQYAFLKSYKKAVQGERPDFATGSSNTAVTANTEVTVTAPSDAKYIVFLDYYIPSAEVYHYLPTDLKINGNNVEFFTQSVFDKIKEVADNAVKYAPSIKISKINSTSFNVKVYSDSTGEYLTHQFVKMYNERDMEYGDNQTKHLVTCDCWYPSEIYDKEGHDIIQGNINFINSIKSDSGDFEHEGMYYAGEGHGCAVSVYTIFYADGKTFDPTTLTTELECDTFRFVEKVNYYAIDDRLTADGRSYPKLDANGDMILANIHYADAVFERNNKITTINRLTVKRDHTVFNSLYAGMNRVYASYFSHLVLNDPNNSANGFSNDGTSWSFTDDGDSGIVLADGVEHYLLGNNVIFYGNKYFYQQTIETNRPFDKMNYRNTVYNTPKSIKIYQQPVMTEDAVTAIGGTADEFMNGDVIECKLTRKIDCKKTEE